MAQTTHSFAAEWAQYRQSGISGDWSSVRAATEMGVGTDARGYGSEDPNAPQMLSWESLRNPSRAEVDALVRVRCASHPGGIIVRGASLFARLPVAPFTPSAGLAHMLHRSGRNLRLYFGVFDPLNLPPAGSSVDLGTSMPVGAWHWMRLQVTRTTTHEVLRGKMWVDGEPEPAWQVTRSRPLTGSGIPAVGGAIGVGNGGSGGWSQAGLSDAAYEWDYASDLLAPGAARIRSSVSEDAGSLFQATQAAAVELGLSEAFGWGEDVPAGRLRFFSEALTPDEVAVSYYPLPTRNQEMLTTVEGETNLGRLAGVYPAGIMVPATSIPGASGGVVTAQQAIQHVTNQWASEHPWLSFAPIPDLRLMVPSAVAAPRQHYIDNPGDGVLTTAAVVIPQEGNERRSMREILDEWLAIFPGTIVRQTSTGVIELVPRVGPDAPSGAAVTLTWSDLTGISDGEDDPSGVTNRCRVTSQGWEFTDNQTLRPPAFVVSIGGLGIDRSVLDGEAVIPDDAEEFQPWRTIPFTVLVDGGNNVTVNVSITAFGSWNRTTASAFSTEGTASPSVTLAVGQSAEVSITHTSRALSVTARWRLTRVSSVAIDVAPVSVPSYAENPLGRTYLAYLLEFDIIGTAWVRSNESVTSEFGQDGVGIPADGGGDAIANSRAQYGERLAQLQSNIFQLTPEQAQAAAQSYVLWNVNPRTIRDVQQSEWNRYPVKFDHIGRLVDLPTGERAVVENRSYSDSFSSTRAAMTSSFSASVTEIVIDTTTDWLLLDNGDFMQLDSGTLLEAS